MFLMGCKLFFYSVILLNSILFLFAAAKARGSDLRVHFKVHVTNDL
jgi:hypothetical protein